MAYGDSSWLAPEWTGPLDYELDFNMNIYKRYFVILANIEAFTVLFQAVVDHPVPERPATAKRVPNPWLAFPTGVSSNDLL